MRASMQPSTFSTSISPRQVLAFVVAAGFALIAASVLPAQAQTYSIIHNFTGGGDGSAPDGRLTLSRAGNLYGTTIQNGAGQGTVYELRHAQGGWTISTLYNFPSSNDGSMPQGGVTFGSNGFLYGTTLMGGGTQCHDGGGCGVAFSLQPPATVCKNISCLWTEAVIHVFGQDGDEATFPTGDLVVDAAQNLYGTTTALGNSGTVFQIQPSQQGWVESVILAFNGSNGWNPTSGLILDTAGNLYGTTEWGGPVCGYPDHCGVVFELSRSASGWTETILYAFQNGSDGAQPNGGLIFDAAGNLYGTTSSGGANGGGTVFELTPANGSWNFHLLYSFTGGIFQVGPTGSLAMDGSGNLYGVTASEGLFGDGNIFKLSPSGGSWTYTDLHDFAGSPTDGAFPEAGLTLDPAGNLYGTTGFGGSNPCEGSGCGVAWQITP